MKNFLFLLIGFVCFSCGENATDLNIIQGNAIGTTYSIKYLGDSTIDFEGKIDSLITAVNKSTSTYISTSDISKINNGDTTVVVDEIFKEVFRKSHRIYTETEGQFDPTVGILVNAWGFGPEKALQQLSDKKVDSLLQYVGLNKVEIKENKVIKKNKNIYLDFNAIGKGYLVDVIGRMFEKNNVGNYLVEIGGEIRARGINQKGVLWRVAIEEPNFDGTRSLMSAISLNNESIATSGNYRKYRLTDSGKKYVHTINAKTGYAKESNLLSASVISKRDCADVDGYATAFMAMGLEKTKEFVAKYPKLKVFLIFENENSELETFASFDVNE